jgi:WD40 repeat protein
MESKNQEFVEYASSLEHQLFAETKNNLKKDVIDVVTMLHMKNHKQPLVVYIDPTKPTQNPKRLLNAYDVDTTIPTQQNQEQPLNVVYNEEYKESLTDSMFHWLSDEKNVQLPMDLIKIILSYLPYIVKGKCVKTLQGHAGPVNCLIELANKLIASGSADSTIKIWDSTQCIKTLYIHRSPVLCLTQLSNNLLVSGFEDGTIMICDLTKSENECINTLQRHFAPVLSLTPLKNGRFASLAKNGFFIIWDSTRKNGDECVAIQQCNASPAFHPLHLFNGITATTSYDSTINLLDLTKNKNERLKKLKGHSGQVLDLIQRYNGQLVSGSADKTIRIWE